MKSTATSSVLLLMLCLGGINAPAYCAQEQQAPGEVPNLEEAAALLKVDKKELESAAQHGSIPARQIHIGLTQLKQKVQLLQQVVSLSHKSSVE